MQKKLSFKDSSGINLVGILSDPIRNRADRIVILAHGFNSNKESKTYTSLERALNKAGVATFRYDSYAHGESAGNFELITIAKSIDGMNSAIDLIKGRRYKQIVLLGNSFNGLSAAYVASERDDLDGLVLSSPVSDYTDKVDRMNPERIKEWKEKGYVMFDDKDGVKKVLYGFYKDASKYKSYEIASMIVCPTLIIHGDKDLDVPFDQSVKLSKLIPACKFVAVKGADHDFKLKRHFEKRKKAVVDFVKDIAT